MEKLSVLYGSKNTIKSFVAALGFSLISVFGYAQEGKAVKDSLTHYFGKESCFWDAIAMKTTTHPQSVYDALAYVRGRDLSIDKAKDYLIGKFLTKSDIAHLNGCSDDDLFGLDTSFVEKPVVENVVNEENSFEKNTNSDEPIVHEEKNTTPVKNEKKNSVVSSDKEEFNKLLARLYAESKKDKKEGKKVTSVNSEAKKEEHTSVPTGETFDQLLARLYAQLKKDHPEIK